MLTTVPKKNKDFLPIDIEETESKINFKPPLEADFEEHFSFKTKCDTV